MIEIAQRIQALDETDQAEVLKMIEEKERAAGYRKSYCAKLTSEGRHTLLTARDRTITFMHGKDLVKYLHVKKWDYGYLAVECLSEKRGRTRSILI